MICDIQSLPITNADSAFDFNGNPIAIGSVVAFQYGLVEGLTKGVVTQYQHHKIKIHPIYNHPRDGLVIKSPVNAFTHHAVVIDDLISTNERNEYQQLTKHLQDFSRSEDIKATKRYIVALLLKDTTTVNSPKDIAADGMVSVFELYGSTMDIMKAWQAHVKTPVYDVYLADRGFADARQAARASKYYWAGWKWSSAKLTDIMLTKRKLEEIGLGQYINKAMSVIEFNALERLGNKINV